MNQYEAFGLGIRSNRPLPGLPPSETSRVDLEIDFAQDRPPEVDPEAARTTKIEGWTSVDICEDGARMLRAASHGGEHAWAARIGADGRRIEVRWRGPLELGDVVTFVEAGALSTAAVLQGVPLLHGCSVECGDAAFLALGAGGVGKSTLAAAGVRAGRALLTDDIAALDLAGDEVRVLLGAARLRMYDDTARALGWDPVRLPRLLRTPGTSPKLFVPLSPGHGLCDGPRRLAAIFVLGERRPGPVRIEPLAPPAALAALLRHTFGDRAISRRARARLLPFWTGLARDVPTHSVAASDDLAQAGALVESLAAATAAPAGV